MYGYNSISNRLLQADFRDYDEVLVKYINYISTTEIIMDYISACGKCELDLEQSFQDVQSRRAVFWLGDTDEEEVRNVYAILKFIITNKKHIPYGIGMAYTNSTKYQEILKAFNERVTMVLIRHIETYLTKVGIDMGVDDKVVYNISFKDGQLNIANDNAVINATNNTGMIDQEQLERLLEKIVSEMEKSHLSVEDEEIVKNSINVIKEECKEANPRKNFLNAALNGIKFVKGTAEFSAAVIALVQFFQTL